MWKLLREIGLYSDHYGDISPHRIDASSMPLHEITCAKSLALSALKKATKRQPEIWSFAEKAFVYLTEPLPSDFFNDLPEEAARHTSKKWKSHVEALERWGVLEPTEYRLLKHIAYYFAVPKNEEVARAVWNGRTLSRSCRFPPPPVNLPFLPDLIRRLVLIMEQPGSLCLLTADFSHYFYIIPCSHDLSYYFGVAMADGVDKDGSVRYKAWRFPVLPMGHSYSPWAAQSIGWAGILHKEKDEEELFLVPANLTQLPTFINIKGGGFICLFYDNIFAAHMNPDVMVKVKARLTRNFGPVDRGGFNFTCNYLELHSAKKLRNPDTPADYLGVEFSLATKAQRDEVIPKGTLRWRQGQKKYKKWMTHNPDWNSIFSSRCLTSYIGRVLWRHSITLRPLCGLAPVIRILRRVAKFRQSSGCTWDDAVVQLTQEEQNVLALHWDIISRNQYESGIACSKKLHRVRLVSDSSDAGYGYLVFSDDGKVELEKGHLWSKSLSHCHIYIKELMAAVFAIRYILATSPPNIEINIGVDNTAAASSLRNMYSGNVMACEVLDKLYFELQGHNATLRVWSLRSEENASDPSSRGKSAHPELVEACYRVMLGQEEGHRLNVPATYLDLAEGVRHPEYEEDDTPIDSLIFAEHPFWDEAMTSN